MIPTVDLIGYVAAAMGTFLLVPQLMKTIHTKNVEGLSLVMLILYVISCVVWTTYGVLIGSLPIILCNTIAFCIGAAQITCLFTYRKPLVSA